MKRICPPLSVPAGTARTSAKTYLEQKNSQRPWCQAPDDEDDPTRTTAVASSSSPPPTLSPQQQPKDSTGSTSNNGSCRGEGEICFSGGDCCSEFCRGFPNVNIRLCTGLLPTRQPLSEAAAQQRQSVLPQKRGGAAGAKRGHH